MVQLLSTRERRLHMLWQCPDSTWLLS